jgi:hypothetical protein
MLVKLDYLFQAESGVWFYRRRFLKPLVPFIPSAGASGGRSLFKRSLLTKDLNTPGATERYSAARLEYKSIVAEAEGKAAAHAKRTSGTFDELDPVEVATLAARFHAQELADDEERRRSPLGRDRARLATQMLRKVGSEFPPVPQAAEWTLGIRAVHEAVRDAARAMRAYGDTDGIADYWGNEALSLASASGRELSPGGPSHLALCEALHNAAVAASEEALRRLDGDLVPTPAMPELPKRSGASSPASTRTLGDLIKAFKADRLDKWSTSATRNFVPVERVMLEVLGADTPLAKINRETGRELFDVVKRLPKGMGTSPKLKKLSVAEAIELGLPGLSPKSINGTYLSTMKALFRFALQEQWMVAHPMLGLSVVDPVNEADKRDPFTIDQLNTIFSGPPWSPRNDAPRGKPLHYWGPLIALLSSEPRI